MTPLNVLVVDDSTFTRQAIQRYLTEDPELRVVGQARNGAEALQLLGTLDVDVITLDLDMPEMDGLTTLKALRNTRPVKVVVVSSLTQAGADATIQALALGAFDVVAKPDGGPVTLLAMAAELRRKVRAAGGLLDELARPVSVVRPFIPVPPIREGMLGAVLIGTSTGGPPALMELIPGLPADFPLPVVVLQHMPPGYTRSLAERLNRLSRLEVREAEDGDVLRPGLVLIAPGGRQLGFKAAGGGARVVVSDDATVESLYSPSIDHAYTSAARVLGAGALAIVLTGMGSDGAAGVVAIRSVGGRCWAQDEATSTIFGMPKAAIQAGCIDAILPLGKIAGKLNDAFSTPRN